MIEKLEVTNFVALITPVSQGANLPSLDKISNTAEIKTYRRLLQKLLYLSRCGKFHITYPVDLFSRHSSKLRKTIWALLKNLLGYLKGPDWRYSTNIQTFPTSRCFMPLFGVVPHMVTVLLTEKSLLGTICSGIYTEFGRVLQKPNT